MAEGGGWMPVLNVGSPVRALEPLIFIKLHTQIYNHARSCSRRFTICYDNVDRWSKNEFDHWVQLLCRLGSASSGG